MWEMDTTVAEAREPGSCSRLHAISSDFRDLVQTYCPRCNGEGATCMVETIRELGDDEVESADVQSPR